MPVIRPTRADFGAALERLHLQPDGEPFVSLSSWVGPVRYRDQPAFLKVTRESEELAGVHALLAWNGNGAVRVLAEDGDAFVLERAGQTIREKVAEDAAATAVLCDTAARLHAVAIPDLERFVTLRRWFRQLFANTDPRFDPARRFADALVDSGPTVLLHGDIHHENVLDGGPRGWLAIDPKGIAGPAPFDYCNLFTNWTPEQSVEHFDSRLAFVSDHLGLARETMLRWVAAWSALSGIWHLDDDNEADAAYPHMIMDEALARLP